MSTLDALQSEIAGGIRRGDSFDSVEADRMDRSALPEAEQAALWLYGWSFAPWQSTPRSARRDRRSRRQPGLPPHASSGTFSSPVGPRSEPAAQMPAATLHNGARADGEDAPQPPICLR